MFPRRGVENSSMWRSSQALFVVETQLEWVSALILRPFRLFPSSFSLGFSDCASPHRPSVWSQQLEDKGQERGGHWYSPKWITMFGIETQGGKSGGQNTGLLLNITERGRGTGNRRARRKNLTMTNETFKLRTSVTLGSFRHWKRWDDAGRLATKTLNNPQIHQSYDFFTCICLFWGAGWFLIRCVALKRT